MMIDPTAKLLAVPRQRRNIAASRSEPRIAASVRPMSASSHLTWTWWRPVAQRPLPIARFEEHEREITCLAPLDLQDPMAALSDHDARKLVRTSVRPEGLRQLHVEPVLLEFAETLLLAVIVEHSCDLGRPKYL